eukprot:jgi/Mesen1/3592/ME000020S03123
MARAAGLLVAAVLMLACSHVSGASLVGGTPAVSFLMTKWISNVNTVYKTKIVPYKPSTTSETVAAVSKNVLPIGYTDVAPFGKFAKFTYPQVIATYALFTQTLNVQLVSAKTLVGILTGTIKRWEQVPQSIRTGPITLVAQFHSSGNTFWTTKYLKAAYPAWPARLTGSGPFKYGANTQYVLTEVAAVQALLKNRLAVGFVETATAYSGALREICIPDGLGKPVTTLVTSVYPAISTLKTYKPSESYLPINLIFKKTRSTFPIIAFMYAVTKQSLVPLGANGGLAKAFLLYTQSNAAQLLARKNLYNALPSRFTVVNKRYINSLTLAKGIKLAFKPPL